jgi:hypothetical protein
MAIWRDKMKYLALPALLLCSVTAMASGQNAETYDYSQHLDIAKVIEFEAVPDVCELVTTHMTYEDHQGQRHVLAYQVMGKNCY